MVYIIISTLLWFLEIVCVVLGAVMMTRTVARILPPKTGLGFRAAAFVLFAATMTVPSWLGDANFLFMLPAFVGVFLLCYGGDLPARVVTGAAFYTLLMSWNTIIDTVDDWTRLLGLEAYENVWTPVLCKILLWVAVYFAAKKLISGDRRIKLTRPLWLLCGVLGLTPLGAVVAFSLWNVKPYEMGQIQGSLMGLAYTILAFALLSSAALLYALTVLSRSQELEQAQGLAAMREVYYQGLQREQTGLRTLRHDMRNHLTALQGLLEAGQTAQAEGYIARLGASPSLAAAAVFCQNQTVNVVLSSKKALMESRGLAADFALTMPEKLSVSDVDICALLGNGLDNAIEGAADADHKTVVLRGRADRGMLMLKIENAVGHGLKEKNGKFLTTKDAPGSHGLGLAGMEEIAQRYGGTMEAKAENGRFTLVVCLPLGDG